MNHNILAKINSKNIYPVQVILFIYKGKVYCYTDTQKIMEDIDNLLNALLTQIFSEDKKHSIYYSSSNSYMHIHNIVSIDDNAKFYSQHKDSMIDFLKSYQSFNTFLNNNDNCYPRQTILGEFLGMISNDYLYCIHHAYLYTIQQNILSSELIIPNECYLVRIDQSKISINADIDFLFLDLSMLIDHIDIIIKKYYCYLIQIIKTDKPFIDIDTEGPNFMTSQDSYIKFEELEEHRLDFMKYMCKSTVKYINENPILPISIDLNKLSGIEIVNWVLSISKININQSKKN